MKNTTPCGKRQLPSEEKKSRYAFGLRPGRDGKRPECPQKRYAGRSVITGDGTVRPPGDTGAGVGTTGTGVSFVFSASIVAWRVATICCCSANWASVGELPPTGGRLVTVVLRVLIADARLLIAEERSVNADIISFWYRLFSRRKNPTT